MAKLPEYNLQSLYEMRERSKKETEDEYAKRQQELHKEQEILTKMEKTLQDMKALRTQKTAEYSIAMQQQHLTIEKIQSNGRHIESLKDKEKEFQNQIETQKEAVNAAKQRSEEALKVMLDATQEFKVLEKHKEKWLYDIKKEIMKKEEEAAEEIAQAQYVSKSKNDDG